MDSVDMPMTDIEIADITRRWRENKLYIEDVGALLHDHKHFKTELQEAKAKLDIAVHMLLLTASDNQLNDIIELGNMAKQTLEQIGVKQ